MLLDSNIPTRRHGTGEPSMKKSAQRRFDSSESRGPIDPQSGFGEWAMPCRVCGREFIVDTTKMNAYLANGWPLCCGQEMIPTIRPIGD